MEDITFQITQWQALDYEYETPLLETSDDNESYLIKLYGVTTEGVHVSVNVLNFTPFFMIKLHHQVTSLFMERLKEHVAARLPFALKAHFLDAKLQKRKDFWGYQADNKFNYVRFTFTSLNCFRAAMRMFQRDIQILGIHNKPTRYKLYESNIDPFIRFMHIKNIAPSGWVQIPANSYHHNFDILPTTSKIDVSCDWKVVKGIEKDKIAPLVIASFDIECTSSHGDFPVGKKDYKKTAYELLQSFNEGKITEMNIVNEILGCMTGESVILSRVYPKQDQPINTTFIKGRLLKLREEFINILKGKVVFKKDQYTSVPKASKDEIMKTLTRRLGTWEGTQFTGFMPYLEGDPIIQIGTTVHKYGERECSYKNIVTLGSCDDIEGAEVISCETEQELLLKWREVITNIDPDIVTGYNIFGFDMSYMYDRAMELGIAEEFCKIGKIRDHSCNYVEKTLSSSALGDNLLKYIDMDGRVLIDIMKVVQRDHKLDSYKLDAVASHFMKMNKNDVSPNDIFRLQKGSAGDRRTIAEYCIQDCALCNKLMMKLEILANNIGMSNVCNVPLSFIFMRGQGVKIFSLVAKQCREDDFMIPTIRKSYDDEDPEDEEGYEGAIVLPPKQGIYLEDPVSVLDYASLYPSSMISENLSHDCIVLDSRYDNLPGVDYLDISYDVYEVVDDKKVKVGEKICRFVQLPNGEKGVIPRILMKLLKARKDTRKKMEYQSVITKDGRSVAGLLSETEDVYTLKRVDGTSDTVSRADVISVKDTYDEFEKAVLDGLQVAYKVTANSLYGQVGARTSPIYLKDIAACTTATGRNQILKAKRFIEENYKDAEIVYGDSVTGDTPLIIKYPDDTIDIVTIESLSSSTWRPYNEFKCNDKTLYGKEQSFVDLHVWTKDHWTRIKRVIRHFTNKKLYRVSTLSGSVDVTEDHSLICDKGNKIKPLDCIVGETRLSQTFPNHNSIKTSLSIESAWESGFRSFDKVPKDILNSPFEIRDAFLQGCIESQSQEQEQINKGIITLSTDSKLYAQGLYYVAMSLGYKTLCLREEDNNYIITNDYDSQKYNESRNILSSLCELKSHEVNVYVYDLETECGKFHAGVGDTLVSNTDSLFVKINPKDCMGNFIKGKDAILPSIRLAQEMSKNFKVHLKAPHDLEYEKTFWPFILFSKKRYCANKYEMDDVKYKMNSMGIALKRRDNAPIVKHIYGGVLDIILNKQDIKESIKFMRDNLLELIDGKFPLESLVITKSLRADYKDPERIAHKVLAERMGERDPGNKPMVNDRIPFVYIDTPATKIKQLQGDRIEHPDFIRKNSLKPDYEFYITNQIMKPVLQLYALTIENLEGYNKGPHYFSNMEKKLLIEKGDAKKAKERLDDLKEAEVQKILFDPVLSKIRNKRMGLREITDFFKKN